MKLIVGLGNPGKQYQGNRHNVGFMTLDYFAETNEWSPFHPAAKWQAEISEGKTGGESIILAKPQTFMNKSGQAIQKIMQFYKVQPPELLVVYDELALDFGLVRSREGGSSAGHKGVESLIQTLSDGFVRLRIGIANEHTAQHDAKDFVLQDFSKDEYRELPRIFDYVSATVQKFIASSQLEPHTQNCLENK